MTRDEISAHVRKVLGSQAGVDAWWNRSRKPLNGQSCADIFDTDPGKVWELAQVTNPDI